MHTRLLEGQNREEPAVIISLETGRAGAQGAFSLRGTAAGDEMERTLRPVTGCIWQVPVGSAGPVDRQGAARADGALRRRITGVPRRKPEQRSVHEARTYKRGGSGPCVGPSRELWPCTM